MLKRGAPNISYYLIDDICGFLVNKWTKPLLGDLNLAKVVCVVLFFATAYEIGSYICAGFTTIDLIGS